MRYWLVLFGLPDLSRDQFWVILALALVCAMLMGWIADALFGEDGFGVFFNAVIVVAGACAGLYLWKRFGLRVSYDPRLVLAGVASAGGLVSLILCGGLRRFV